MGDFLTSHFIYSPWYRTQCIQLNAQAADVPQGTIICAKGAAGSVAVTVSDSGGASADGTFDIIGAENYGAVYGILLRDVTASESAQAVDVIVCGELFRETVNSVYKAANSDNDIPESTVVALRNLGIILK